MLDVSHVGTARLFTLAASATPGATALPLDFMRPYQGFGNITYIEPASSSNYHSLQTSFNRRFTQGSDVGCNSHLEGVDQPGINGFGAVRADTNQRLANYGPQDFDRRQNFNINSVYSLPKATKSMAARASGYAAIFICAP